MKKNLEPDQLIGIWKLEGVSILWEEGGVHYPFGRNPCGTITYLVGGTMAVHIAGSDDWSHLLRVYAGCWSIEGDRVIHDVEQSVEPELRGQRLERRASLEGDVLTYTTLEPQGPGHPVVIWRRCP